MVVAILNFMSHIAAANIAFPLLGGTFGYGVGLVSALIMALV